MSLARSTNDTPVVTAPIRGDAILWAVCGVDLSLTSTGVAWPDGTTETLTTRARGMERIRLIRDAICRDDRVGTMTLFVIEGYSFGSRASQAHALGELGGVVRVFLHEAMFRWVDVAPSSLKRFAVGKGNAKKEEMLGAAIRRLNYAGNSNDEADALWLREMGLHALGRPSIELPKQHRDALRAVDWPFAATNEED